MSDYNFVEWKLPDDRQYDNVYKVFEKDCFVYKDLVLAGKLTSSRQPSPSREDLPIWRLIVWNPEKGVLKACDANDYQGIRSNEHVVVHPGKYAQLLEESAKFKNWKDNFTSEIKLSIVNIFGVFIRNFWDKQTEFGTDGLLEYLTKNVNSIRKTIVDELSNED